MDKSHFFQLIRGLHVLTSFLALAATVQNYLSSEALKRTHILDSNQISYIAARIQCMFTLLSAACRVSLIKNINNKPVYYLAMCTYGIVLWYIYMEIRVFKTATLGPSLVPLIIAVVMLTLMSIGLYIWDNEAKQETKKSSENKKSK